VSHHDQKKRGEWATFIATLLIAGLMAAWALIPTKVLEATWQAEQQQMSAWAGESTNRWILSQTVGAMNGAAKDAERTAAGLGDSGAERWLTDRIYASLLWASLIAYRAHALTMWGLLGIPLILAASVDGFYVREIRKTAFISQSPIRHKIGVHSFRLVGVAMVAWLCLPVPMPAIAALAVVCFAAVSLWLWVGHLQKRL
jgi:hypothetical protein